ncbi:MAG TPA: hypothetical protein DCQ93_01815 [Bacteroidetes bacterium]|nr:hypothetical protein [Bacteroidota bacterium]
MAIEEMCHLSIVSNLLTSIGGAPHFARPNLPQDTPKYYPPGFSLDLQPFTRESLQRFVSYENPNNPELKAAEFKNEEEKIRAEIFSRVDDDCQLMEEDIPFNTIHDLYSCISEGFQFLEEQHPGKLFLCDSSAQLTNSKEVRLFDELFPIVDLATVNESIRIILEQGEGNTSNVKGHFRIFSDILEEYETEIKISQEKNIEFIPARNCIENPFIHQPADASEVNIIEDEFTAEISLLFNSCYDTMMKMIIRAFNHHEETTEEVSLLCDTFISFMHDVITPLGTLLTTLPMGGSYGDKTAGPSFEYPRDMHLLPHKKSAWQIFSEQLELISKFAAEFSNDERAAARAKSVLADVAIKLAGFAEKLK